MQLPTGQTKIQTAQSPHPLTHATHGSTPQSASPPTPQSASPLVRVNTYATPRWWFGSVRSQETTGRRGDVNHDRDWTRPVSPGNPTASRRRPPARFPRRPSFSSSLVSSRLVSLGAAPKGSPIRYPNPAAPRARARGVKAAAAKSKREASPARAAASGA